MGNEFSVSDEAAAVVVSRLQLASDAAAQAARLVEALTFTADDAGRSYTADGARVRAAVVDCGAWLAGWSRSVADSAAEAARSLSAVAQTELETATALRSVERQGLAL